MYQMQYTPPLATPGILLNQDLLPHEWDRVRSRLRNDPSITHADGDVYSTQVITETIESLEHALFDPGNTMLDFMVLATALRYQFGQHHVRLTPAGRNYAIHFVAGQWATPIDRRRKGSSSRPPESANPTCSDTAPPRHPHTAGSDNAPPTADLAPADTHLVDRLEPRSLHYVFQVLCGTRLAIDIPEEPLSNTASETL